MPALGLPRSDSLQTPEYSAQQRPVVLSDASPALPRVSTGSIPPQGLSRASVVLSRVPDQALLTSRGSIPGETPGARPRLQVGPHLTLRGPSDSVTALERGHEFQVRA